MKLKLKCSNVAYLNKPLGYVIQDSLVTVVCPLIRHKKGVGRA